jgi:hypothetical protein
MPLSNNELNELVYCPSRLRAFSDADLMNALRQRCNDALAILFERHSTRVFRIARAILRDDEKTEETVQRVFLDIYGAANQFNPDSGPFTAWLLQYARHRSFEGRAHLDANDFCDLDGDQSC